MAIGRFLFMTVDCLDPQRLARFWAELLGTEVGDPMDDGRYVFLAAREGLPVICFQRVPEPKVGKARLHLDLSVDDLESATRAVADLGGSWPGEGEGGVEHELEGYSWRTLADPEGNEFDVVTG